MSHLSSSTIEYNNVPISTRYRRQHLAVFCTGNCRGRSKRGILALRPSMLCGVTRPSHGSESACEEPSHAVLFLRSPPVIFPATLLLVEIVGSPLHPPFEH